jgi:Secretion system C-terminal sorting domain
MNQIKLIFIVLLLPFLSNAQHPLPPPQPHVIYTYDAAGNRIQRKMILIDIMAPIDPDKPISQSGLFRVGSGNASNALSSDDATPIGESDVSSSIVSMQVFPNPTTGIFTLQLSEGIKKSDIIIYDANGEKVLTKSCASTQESMDISQLPAGAYQITVSSGEWYGRASLIKE